MATSLDEAINILQEAHRNVEGVIHAPYTDDYPRAEIDHVAMPIVLTFAGEKVRNYPFGMGCRAEARAISVVVIVADTNYGLTTESSKTIYDLIDALNTLYTGESISTDNADLHIEYNRETPSDTGLDDAILHGATTYYGTRFDIVLWRKY